MPAIDVEALLSPVAPDAPCGPNLESDPAFNALETLARGKPGAEFQKPSGEFITFPAQEPKWRGVQADAAALFRRSKDLRTLGYLAAAAIREDGYQGARGALQLLRGLLERHWEPMHPQIDPADPDPIVRVNAISTLAAPVLTPGDPFQIVSKLLDAPLTNSRQFGQFGVRQDRIARGELSPEPGSSAPPVQASTIEAAFKDTPAPELVVTRAAVVESLALVEAIKKIVADRLGAERAPSLTALQQALQSAATLLARHLDPAGMEETTTTGPGEPAKTAWGSGGGSGGSALSGDIRSHKDVLVALEKIVRYYEQSEVSSPVPVVMAAARRLVGLKFGEISRILTPESIRLLEEMGKAAGEAKQ